MSSLPLDFVCPSCGARNAAATGPCADCGSTSYRGDRDAPATKGETYQKVADTVGLVPSLRWKDNLYQGIAIAVTGAFGAAIGLAVGGTREAVLGGLAIGLFVGFVISGVVLMILGWVRLARGRR